VREARYVRDVARRVAALLLLSPRLDETYRAAKASGHARDEIQ
jgi:hypothetical protein